MATAIEAMIAAITAIAIAIPTTEVAIAGAAMERDLRCFLASRLSCDLVRDPGVSLRGLGCGRDHVLGCLVAKLCAPWWLRIFLRSKVRV